ncbi:MAG TPA: hypothetical protein VIL29_01250, partial [Pseudothermotoga sp.]
MKTLRGKMLVTILLPVALLVSVVALITFFQLRTSVDSIVEEMAFEVANRASDTVNEWINGLIKEI